MHCAMLHPRKGPVYVGSLCFTGSGIRSLYFIFYVILDDNKTRDEGRECVAQIPCSHCSRTVRVDEKTNLLASINTVASVLSASNAVANGRDARDTIPETVFHNGDVNQSWLETRLNSAVHICCMGTNRVPPHHSQNGMELRLASEKMTLMRKTGLLLETSWPVASRTRRAVKNELTIHIARS